MPVSGGTHAALFPVFLKSALLPCTQSEVLHLYPAVDALIREHTRTTMEIDNEFIADYVQRIKVLHNAPIRAHQDAGSVPEIIELEAVLMRMHLAMEEKAYLPLLEQYIGSDERRWEALWTQNRIELRVCKAPSAGANRIQD